MIVLPKPTPALLQSTPLRLTVVLVILFSLVSLTSLGASYFIIRNSITNAIEADLEQEMAGFQNAEDAGALLQLVSATSGAMDPERRLIAYTGPRGELVGNADLARLSEGYELISLDDDGRYSDYPYLTLTSDVEGGRLTIATSTSQIDDLGELFANILWLSVLPTTVLALAAGLFFARRSARRIDAVGRALERLEHGDLSARVGELPGGTDDLSSIGHRVDLMALAQEASVSALRQVSADIAHDLKTPIQRVVVLLNRASELPDLPPSLEPILDDANRETAGIVATFQSLLQIAQIEGGSPKKRFGLVDLAALARTFCEVYEPAADESGHALICYVSEEPVMAPGDKSLLGQVFANLIENALRHTSVGSQITVTVRPNRGAPVIEVSDSGPGIPMEERENVLRRLYRLERSRTTLGNGLGLSLVAAIVDMHEGDLRLEDNDPGLKVVITFPAKEAMNANPR